MKEWRERHPSSATDFSDPATANQTPGRRRGRIAAATRARGEMPSTAVDARREMLEAEVANDEDDSDYELGSAKPKKRSANAISVPEDVDDEPGSAKPKKRARTVQAMQPPANAVTISDDDDVSDGNGKDMTNNVTLPRTKSGQSTMARNATATASYLSGRGKKAEQADTEEFKIPAALRTIPAHPSYGHFNAGNNSFGNSGPAMAHRGIHSFGGIQGYGAQTQGFSIPRLQGRYSGNSVFAYPEPNGYAGNHGSFFNQLPQGIIPRNGAALQSVEHAQPQVSEKEPEVVFQRERR